MSGPPDGQRLVRLAHPADPVAWRDAARALLAEGVAPERVIWQAGDAAPGDGDDLFAAAAEAVVASSGPSPAPSPEGGSGSAVADGRATPRVPRAFPALVADVACHRDERRFALLYRVLWRLTVGERGLLDDPRDADVHALEALAKAVRRDRHKMTAFVRFRRLADDLPGTGGAGDGIERYAAWFEPEHRIVRSTADFFARRFATMAFSIFTPSESVHWDTRELVFGPGATRRAVPGVEPVEALWREYYASTFNPARLKLGAMRAEMPVKYWRNLPEADLIRPLAREAHRRAGAMIDAAPTTAPGFAVRAGLVVSSAPRKRPGGAGDVPSETRPDPHSDAAPARPDGASSTGSGSRRPGVRGTRTVPAGAPKGA